MKKGRDAQHGVAIVLIAVSIFALCIIVAIAVNIGKFVSVRTQAQAAVDAAALAGLGGIRYFQEHGGNETNVAKLVASFNGGPGVATANVVNGADPNITAAPDEATGAFNSNDDYSVVRYNADGGGVEVWAGLTGQNVRTMNGVQVTKTYTVDHFLRGVVGSQATTFTVSAVAAISGPRCARPTVPLAITKCTHCPDNVEVCSGSCCSTASGGSIKLTPKGGGDNAAWFSYVGDPSNADIIRDYVAHGMTKDLCYGELINLNNGEDNTAHKCMEDMYAGNAECEGNVAVTQTIAIENGKWKALLPVVECQGALNGAKRVVGFANFYIDTVKSLGSPKYIDVTHVCNDIVDYPAGGVYCGSESRYSGLVQ